MSGGSTDGFLIEMEYNVKRIYRTKRAPLFFLSAIVLFLITGPPVVSHSIDAEFRELILANIAIYVFYSPLIVLLFYIIIKNFKTKIIITGDGIEWTSVRKTLLLNWNEVEYFVFDHIRSPQARLSPERYLTIYELGGKNGEIRFHRTATDDEVVNTADYYEIKPFRIKSFSFDAYGMHLEQNACQTLQDYIRNYTELEPERKKGLFENAIQQRSS